MGSVYLSGPMSGYSESQVFNWRYRTTKQLDEMGFDVKDPGFNQEEWWNTEERPDSTYVYQRDKFLLENANIVVANMLDIKEQDHIGVWWELGIADTQDKLIIIVTKDQKIINHPFVKSRAIVFGNFDEVLDFLTTL